MKRTLIALIASAALITGTLATPQPARADPISAWWLVPAIFGGMWLGGAWASGAQARPFGFAPAYGYAPAGTAYAASYSTGAWNNCWMERRRVGGVVRNARVCIQ